MIQVFLSWLSFQMTSSANLEAAKALLSAKPMAASKAANADASLHCAEKLLAAGNKSAAKITYEKLLANTPSKQVKDAATRGVTACGAA